jgi:Spy/CpxP family protein refolding chaperone
MTRLRYLALGIGLAVLLAAGSTGADDKKDDKKADPPRRGGFVERLTNVGGPLVPTDTLDKLKLTADQKEKVEKLQKEFADKEKEAVGKAREAMQKAVQDRDRDAIRKAAEQVGAALRDGRKLRDDYEGKVKAVLTDDQKKTYEAALKERPRGGIAGGFPGGAGGFGRAAQGPKELSSPDVQQKLNLTAEQKEKLEKLKKEFEEKSLGVLTDEQKKKFEEIKKEQPRGPGSGRQGVRPGRGDQNEKKDEPKKEEKK